MPVPIIAALGRMGGALVGRSFGGLLANLGGAVSGGRGGRGRKPPKLHIDTEPFEKMVKAIDRDFAKGHPKEMEKLIKTLVGTVLGRTANDLGVASPKGKFSKKISVGKKHLTKRYTWKRPASRGRAAGVPPGQYKDVAKSIRINGRKFSLRSYIFYERQGSISLVTSALARIRAEAVKRVGSGKAAFYKIAKDLKLPTNRFRDKSELISALNACGQEYKRVSSGKEVERGFDYTVEIKSTARNALNPTVKGKAEFQKKINGIQREFGTLVRKGYIKSLDDIVKRYGADIKG